MIVRSCWVEQKEEVGMSLTPEQLKALRRWRESKEITDCPACGEEEFGNIEQAGRIEEWQEDATAGDVALIFLPSRVSGVEAQRSTSISLVCPFRHNATLQHYCHSSVTTTVTRIVF
jgi:hypothetical protein